MSGNQSLANISTLESLGCQQTLHTSDLSTFNSTESIQESFVKSYGLLTINSPSKKHALLNLLHEYSQLSGADRAGFDQWLLTQSAQQR